MRFLSFVRHRPVLASIIALGVVLAVGTIVEGPEFITEPIPLPEWLAQTWTSFNGVFMLVTAALAYRRLRQAEDWLTWQEKAVLRGIIWILVGGSLGYLSRLVAGSAQVSLGTPAITLGALCIAYAALGESERRESELALKDALDSYEFSNVTLPNPYEVRRFLDDTTGGDSDDDGSSGSD